MDLVSEHLLALVSVTTITHFYLLVGFMVIVWIATPFMEEEVGIFIRTAQ